MLEQYEDIIKNYDIEPWELRKARNGILINTSTGLKTLKELYIHEHKVNFLYELKEMLFQKGFLVDRTVKAIDGNICIKTEGKSYILNEAIIGRELNLSDHKEILLAVKNMANLHNATLGRINKPNYNKLDKTNCLIDNLKKHNAELIRIRNYIRKMCSWSDFDILYLKAFNDYYRDAVRALNAIKNDHNRILAKYEEKKVIIHGQYNQHNIIIKDNKLYTINFEYATYNLPVIELYSLLRKVLEKNSWDIPLGISMIDQYSKDFDLIKEELKLVLFLIAYPEKFWKISNYYFSLNKAWKPQQTLVKLRNLIKQEDEKKKFVRYLKKYIEG